jgi:hypothetical protein
VAVKKSVASTTVTVALWPQTLGDYTKCQLEAGEANMAVKDQETCQQEAESEGRNFYSYLEDKGKCFSSATCDGPKTTGHNWKVFEKPAAAETDVAPTAWPQYLVSYRKCEQPDGESQGTVSIDTCQKVAEEKGRDFFSYYAEKQKCFTSITCSSPKTTGWAWEIFKRP